MLKILNWKVLFLPILFFIIGVVLLYDYGISWDEPIHFHRGHAYLHYFLTGNKTFEDLPNIAEHYPKYEGFETGHNLVSEAESPVKRSYYQHYTLTMNYFLENDSGHPPLNDILAAGTNYIFYQKLGIIDDVHAHHIFNLLSSALLIFVVCAFAYQKYGTFVALISGIAVITYPLFFAESQFNIKDPPEAAFFAASIWAFWNSLNKGNWKWLLLSVIFAGISFGMKFNILFLPFILLPYLVIRFFPLIKGRRTKVIKIITKVPKTYVLVAIISPLIIALIFVLPWPYLWQDPVGNFLKIFGYYKEIGTGAEAQHAFYGLWKFNLYPLTWILITTQPLILLFTAVGIFAALRNFRDKDKTSLLWLIWLIVPIARVTVPNSSIYGGIRQIFEYIPAMALLTGLGAYYLRERFKNKTDVSVRKISVSLLVLSTLILIIPIIRLHPNENVYFNFLVGGIKGAQEKRVPYMGNSFGNAYKQALDWLNSNAEPEAKFALIQGTALNVPRLMMRSDIQYWNGYWSGILRKGEYLVELTHDDPVRAYPYAWEYVEKMLNPVYEVSVDGVALAKIWKNDLDHTKAEYKYPEVIHTKDLQVSKKDNDLIVQLPNKLALTRFSVSYDKNQECTNVKGRVFWSRNGNDWYQEPEPVPFPQISGDLSVNDKQMNYFFAGKEANFVKFVAEAHTSCIFQNPRVSIYSINK